MTPKQRLYGFVVPLTLIAFVAFSGQALLDEGVAVCGFPLIAYTDGASSLSTSVLWHYALINLLCQGFVIALLTWRLLVKYSMSRWSIGILSGVSWLGASWILLNLIAYFAIFDV